MEDGEGFVVEVLPVFGEPAAAAQPCERAFDDPSQGQDDEALGVIRAFDDFDGDLRQALFHGLAKDRPLVSAVGDELFKERKASEQSPSHQRAAVAVLDVGCVHKGVHQEALRVDQYVPLLAVDFLARVIARRVIDPPFSADFTLWLSTMASVGLASRAARSRHFT